MPLLKGASSVLALLLLWVVSSPAQAQAPTTVNLSLRKTISTQAPVIGDVVSYTVVVVNAPGSATATNVIVTDELPTAGAVYVPASASTVRGNATFTSTTSASMTTGTWSISAIAPGDSAVLVLQATVNGRGVYFNTAEIISADQTDPNSPFGNHSLVEDDYDAVCFSVPILYYAGDEYTVTIPSGYDQVIWYRDNTPISTSTVSTTLAVVNPDMSLTIKSVGTYRFDAFRNGCLATNCCAIQIIQGLYGSLGDYVFLDTNKNGIQDDGPTGIDGVKVYLYDSTGTAKIDSTVTAGGGKYLFDSLTDGKYVVQFIAPAGLQSTSANQGTDDALDSDAGMNGFTGVYMIDTTQPVSSTARNNPTVDAGYFAPTAGLGDFVFYDNNSNGIQDSTETGVPDIMVTLYQSSTAPGGTPTLVASTTTSTTGFYSFTGLTPGSGYYVVFDTTGLMAQGYMLTTPNATTNTALDSDAGPDGTTTQTYSLTADEFNPTVDAGIMPKPGVTNILLTVTDPAVCDPLTNIYSTTATVTLVNVPVGTLTVTDNGILAATISVTAGQTSAMVNLTGISGSSPGSHTVVASLDTLTASTTYAVPNSCTVCSVITLGPINLLNGQVNLPYSQTLTASGGTAPYTYAIINGELPAGLSLNVTSGVISGTPTSASAISFTVLVTDSRACTATAPYTLTVVTVGLALTVTDPAVCDPLTNIYSTTATVTLVNVPVGTLTVTDNGILAATISVTAGQTSAMVNLTGISGSSPGSHTVVASLDTLTASTTYAVPNSCTVCSVITLGPINLLNGQVNLPYSQTLTASGGTAPYTYAIINGELPAGLSLNVTSGVISGTPTSASAISFTVLVTDSRACTATATYTLTPNPAFLLLIVADPTVCNPLSNVYSTTGVVTLVSAPAGTLTITDNGVVTVSVSVTVGQTSVPFNLSGLSGTSPTTHTLVATLTSLTATATYDVPISCTVCETITVLPNTLPGGLVGAAYSQTLTASGGMAPYTYAVIDGGLPVGLSLDVSTGVISGTPISATTLSLTVLVTDSRACTATAPYTLTVVTVGLALTVTDPAVCDPLTNIYSTTATVTLVNVPVGTLTVTDNGILAATISVTAGQTSAMVNLTGISGSSPGSHTVVAALDTLTASTTYAVPTACTACTEIALAPVSLIGGQLGQVYSQTITASGGTAPYSYSVSNGSLPVGLTLNATTGVISGTPASATITAFTVVVTDAKSCTGSAPYSLTVGTNCPTNFTLVVSQDAGICNGDSIRLTATTTVAGATINWYLTPYDGVAFASVASGAFITVRPTTTTVYYAEATTTDGCISPRRPVVVTVTTVPTPICLGNINNTCPATTVDLTQIEITNDSTGLAYEWYTSLSRSAATRVTNLTAVGAGKYYLFARSGNCYSNPTVLTVEIVDCNCQNVAGVNIGPGQTICSGDSVLLRAVLSGSASSVMWTSNGTGVFTHPTSLTTTYVPSAADLASGSVLLTVTTNDPDGPRGVCSAASSSLILTINKRPDAPLGVACDDTLVCQGSSTKLVGFAPGAKINWYDSDNKLIGTTVSGGKLVVTPSKSGSVVYTAEAISPEGCVSSTRSSLTITVGACLADLAVLKKVITPGPYSVGQKITYSITATNNGPITGTDVKVSDVLPASMSYVSSTPAGEYSVGTGTWTIGTLTTGSSRNLLVEAIINGVGSIRNTAIIGGSNNDPRYPQNDTSSVTIEVNQCAVNPPRIDCAITQICAGGSTTLKAVGCEGGTVLWSDGQSGITVSVSPTVTTVYTASCVLGRCISTGSNPITVTVSNPATPVIMASAMSVCPGASVTLTASGCEGGSIEWSEQSQTGASIVVTPYTKTTYTAQCRMGSCLSAPATKTIDIATDIPTPTITCSTTSVCPGETVTLTVNGCLGTPVWSSTTETTGSIVVTPTAGNNTYSVICKNGACSSKPSPTYTIEVITPAIPTIAASADSICAGGLVSLSATGCNGTVLWSNGQTGANITVHPDASISYYAQCRFRTCLSEPSNSVTITVLTPSAPIITANKTLICSGEKVTLTAEGCEGTVKWSGTDALGASIEIMPTATAEYFATCRQGSCESEASNKVRITVNIGSGTAPQIAASTTAVCSGGLVSLTATGCNGTVLWSDGQTGPVVSVSVTPTNNTFFAICKVGSECGSPKSNEIRINVTPVPTPTVTCSTDTICPGEHLTLTVNNCQGTPYWSTGETTVSIVVSPTVTTSYYVYCQDGVCRSDTSINYTITVIPVGVPTITASATVVEPGGTVSLSATGCNGTVIWSAADINGNNQGPTIVVRPEGTQTYFAQCRFRECLSDPSITITINPGDCVAKAGSLTAVNATVCSTTAATLLAATPNGGMVQPAGYSVRYVLTKGASLVVQQISETPQFTVGSNAGGAGEYTIHTLVYNATATDKNYLDLALVKPGISTAADLLNLIADKKICADLDAVGVKIKVLFVEPPRLYGTPSLTVCYGGKVTLGAIGCEGGIVTWQDGSIGQTIEKTIYSDLWIMATCTIDGCTSIPSHSVDVWLGTPGIPTIVSDKPGICTNETVTLTATGCEGGTYIWSDGQTVGNTLTVKPTADVSYRVRCKIGTCEGEWSAYTTIRVGPPVAPTISIVGTTATSTTVCFGAPVTLTAQGCPAGSYVTWSNDLVGQSITVSLANSVTYTARCCNSSTCKSAPSNVIALTVLTKVAQPVTTDRMNTCPFTTVDLSTGVTSQATTTGGVFEYYTSASLTADTKVANPAAVGTGTYYVVEKTANGCYSLPGVIHVHITTCGETVPCDVQNPATASAGDDASICAAKSYQLYGVIGGTGETGHWATSGSGSFDDPFLPNATYTASAEDVLSGKVTLTFSVSAANASCAVAHDEMLLTIGGSNAPTVIVDGQTTFCYGDSVTLRAPAGASSYLWSNRATTQSIVVKTSGVYNVQLFDPSGCSSMKSVDIVVTVSDPAATPLVSNLRNTCPAQIVDLTSALSATTAGSYEYRIGESASSHLVMRPDSVGAGTYYIFAHNSAGCLSAPAKVEASIFNCAADTLTTDVSIAKTASTAVVEHSAPVTYTVRVSNLGQHTAHNIDVRDVLPDGLELVADPAATYSVSNGVITKRIDSLGTGQSDSITFAARVVRKGSVVNTAEITYLDEQDTDPTNNQSSVTVTDTSARRPSLIGLAKSVLGTPASVGDSLIKVSYRFVVSNFGDDTLHHVQVEDDLAYFFVPSKVVEGRVTVAGGSTLKAGSPSFVDMDVKLLLDSTSYLAPGRSQTFTLDVTVRRAAGDTTKAFQNIGVASAVNSVTHVSDLSVDGGDADPDGDGDPTNNTGLSSFTLGEGQPAGPGIGLALGVMRIEKQADSSYNVTYKATLKNFGDVDLYGITLMDSLSRAFATPVSYSMAGAPVVSVGSNLVVNEDFDGNPQPNLLAGLSHLAVGEQDTVVFTVNIKPNGNLGPFFSSATVTGHTLDSTQTVSDISNNGFDPNPVGATSTTVRFDLPKGLLGVAKSVGDPTLVEEGVYDIPYTITLSNMGSVPLKKVQVVDNLSGTFGNGALIVDNRVQVTADSGSLTVDSLYTGQGLITSMLIDSLSELSVGAKSSLHFTVRVDVKNADTLTFYNSAIATALTNDGEAVADTSTAGTNNDPDHDLDPRNNSEMTPVALNGRASGSYIGVAMAVRDTVRQADGSFNVTYQIVVKNYGQDKLKNVTLTDTLSHVFSNQTGATFTLVNAPITTSTGSTLKLNPNFNGVSDPVLVLGDSTSTLAVGKVDTIQVMINVATDGSTTTFLNSVYAEAKAGTGTVSDVSTNGLDPDPNGNGNPTDLNEREATPLSLPPTFAAVFIPQGFSPNGDGVNDRFVIQGTTGLTVSLEVYNRWGNLVYKNDDYQNDWDGQSNMGITLSADASGLPDGTYYYVVRTSDGRKFVRYMTIKR